MMTFVILFFQLDYMQYYGWAVNEKSCVSLVVFDSVLSFYQICMSIMIVFVWVISQPDYSQVIDVWVNINFKRCFRISIPLHQLMLFLCQIIDMISRTFQTTIISINCKSRWTEFAFCLVIDDNTWSSIWTVQFWTRIDTLEVFTCHIFWTSWIFQADGSFSLATLVAHTKWEMIEDLAFLSSWAWKLMTGVLANGRDTGHVRGAFYIWITSTNSPTWASQFSKSIDDQFVFTLASCLMISGNTSLISFANRCMSTWRFAFARLTIQCRGTILVIGTSSSFWLWFCWASAVQFAS